MKAFPAIFRRDRRPARSQCLPLGFGTLERRALLATIGPIASTSASAVVSVAPSGGLGPLPLSTPPAFPMSAPAPNAHGPFFDPDGDHGDHGGNATRPRHDRLMNHVSLAEANVTIDGLPTPMFALADAGISKILVKVGLVGPFRPLDAQGVNRPQSVTLGDLNADGLPDLVVANSGGNNVLVFPGLPGGNFGPEVNGGQGFAVGLDPVGVTIKTLKENALPELVVASKLADQVTILGRSPDAPAWAFTTTETIDVRPNGGAASTGPIKTLLLDVNHDGTNDLFVCNSASNNVYLYRGQADGTFDAEHPTVFDVGLNPNDMLIGRFERKSQLDLVTINAGSNNLTFLGNILAARPTVQTVASGGVMPDAAFAVDLNHNGIMDLVVANSGDGHLALLRGGVDGLQLSGVITQSEIPVPTGLAPAASDGGGIDFFAASAGSDAALLLHFDLNTAAEFPGISAGDSIGINPAEEFLVAQLVPFGDSDLELIAILGAGSPDSEAMTGEWAFRESSSVTALYAPTNTPDESNSTAAPVDPWAFVPQSPDPSRDDASGWARFVLGTESTLDAPGLAFVEAVARRDAPDPWDDRPVDALALADPRAMERSIEFSPEAASAAVDEALRLFWSEPRPLDETSVREDSSSPESSRTIEGIDAPGLDPNLEAVPLISSVALISTRLILRASPPRPVSFLPKPRRRLFPRSPGAGPAPFAMPDGADGVS